LGVIIGQHGLTAFGPNNHFVGVVLANKLDDEPPKIKIVRSWYGALIFRLVVSTSV
jgi:hypothetical protein